MRKALSKRLQLMRNGSAQTELIYFPPYEPPEPSSEWEGEVPATPLNRKIDFVVSYVNGTAAVDRASQRASAETRSRLSDWNELWFNLLSIWRNGRLCLTPQQRAQYGISRPRCLRGKTYVVVANQRHVPFWLDGVKGDLLNVATLTPFQRWLRDEVAVVFHKHLDPCQNIDPHMSRERRATEGCHGVNIFKEDLEMGLFNSLSIEAIIPFYPPLRDTWIYFNNDQVLGRELRLIGDIFSPASDNPFRLRRLLYHEGPQSKKAVKESLANWRKYYQNKTNSTLPESSYQLSNFETAVRVQQRVLGLSKSDSPTVYRFAHVPWVFEKRYVIQLLEENPVNHTVNGIVGRHDADLLVPFVYLHFMIALSQRGSPKRNGSGGNLTYIDGAVTINVSAAPFRSEYRFLYFREYKNLRGFIDAYHHDRRGWVMKPVLWFTLNDEVGVFADAVTERNSSVAADESLMPSANDLYGGDARNRWLPLDCAAARSKMNERLSNPSSLSSTAKQCWLILLQVQVLYCQVIAAGLDAGT